MTVTLQPSKLSGSILVPPSKSMAHRMLICAALAGGVSHIHNLDYSADITASIEALQSLGAAVQAQSNSAQVQGGGGSFCREDASALPPIGPINCNESGSTLRFIIPLFALTGRRVSFTGAPRLYQRPLTAYEEIFSAQGLQFCTESTGLTLQGRLKAGEYRLRGDVSSQFISGLLFALPLLEGDSTLHITPPVESRSYIELTRSAQQLFGVHSTWLNAHTLHIAGGQQYHAATACVEGDWSQAAVPAVLAAVLGGIRIEGLAQNSAQGDRVILDIINQCGGNLTWQEGALCGPAAPAALTAAGEISLADCPDLGPILCTLGAFCSGTTRLVEAGRLRIKESDRIASVEQELGKLGIAITSTQNSMAIQGGHPLQGNQTTQSHNDHRVVMALCAAALCGGVAITIEQAQAINKSWPGFFASLTALGAEVHTQ